MYKVVKSTDAGLDELEIDRLEKGCWIDVVAPSEEELQEIAAATKIQMDFLTAPLDEEEKSRIEIEDDQILILVDIPFLRSNKDYDTLPLGIIITESCITTVCLEPNAVTAEFGAHNTKMWSTFKKTRFLFQILFKSATLYPANFSTEYNNALPCPADITNLSRPRRRKFANTLVITSATPSTIPICPLRATRTAYNANARTAFDISFKSLEL